MTDLDQALEDISKIAKINKNYKPFQESSITIGDLSGWLAELILYRYSFRPNIRGEWIPTGVQETGALGITYKEVKCSCCGNTRMGLVYNFCPNCGADMRKRKDNE